MAEHQETMTSDIPEETSVEPSSSDNTEDTSGG